METDSVWSGCSMLLTRGSGLVGWLVPQTEKSKYGQSNFPLPLLQFWLFTRWHFLCRLLALPVTCIQTCIIEDVWKFFLAEGYVLAENHLLLSPSCDVNFILPFRQKHAAVVEIVMKCISWFAPSVSIILRWIEKSTLKCHTPPPTILTHAGPWMDNCSSKFVFMLFWQQKNWGI